MLLTGEHVRVIGTLQEQDGRDKQALRERGWERTYRKHTRCCPCRSKSRASHCRQSLSLLERRFGVVRWLIYVEARSS